MKSTFILSALLAFFLSAVQAFGQLSWQAATPPEQTQGGTLLFNATGTPLANSTGTLYCHTGLTINGAPWQNVIGSWGNNPTQPALTLVSPNQYKLDITPSIQGFYSASPGSITKINMVVRNSAGNAQTIDLSVNVGAFDVTISQPTENSTTIWSSGAINVNANNTGGNASYALRNPAGQLLDSVGSANSYTFSIATPVNGQYVLTSRLNGVTILKRFNVIVGQVPASEAMPAGIRDGITYNDVDPTKASLMLNAPGKEFVYVAGNFNNWNPGANHSMKKDPASGKFWIELTGLTPGTWYAFQYWVCDNTPNTNSPKVVKTADPFSTLVLSSFDDPEIITLNVYPGLPVFNTIAPGQEREVSVIQTGPNAYWQYNWTSTTKPNATVAKKDLVIYEVLVRDFDSTRSYQDFINRIEYFKGLKINAIQLMPVMEFEGNMSWGYNPVYHLAPDKRYGSPAKLKEFIDLCHQNGIAVILDVALNHVFGRSPLERMWMIDTDNDGWGNGISTDNPYCNVVPKHTLNVGSDLNHFNEPNNLTNTYVMRTIEEWVKEYRIDGFRWDLTQGFTNACTANDGNCTGSIQQDRLTKLKWYADMQWEIDPNFYVIFEHWVDGEIPSYTSYRLGETPAKGIMCWRRGDQQYSTLLKGLSSGLSGITDVNNYRIQGNLESHDEERVMYKALNEAGQTNGNLTKTLARMPALGSMFFLVPGPKMIWHFSELGWNLSVNTCNNGTVNNNCRLDTKPQPQWKQNWMGDPARRKIYDEWAKMIELRTKSNVFQTGSHSFNLTVTGRPRLDIWTSTTPTNALSYVMVHTNLSNTEATFQGFFPFTGTWYNLIDNSTVEVTSTTQNITLAADGGYVVYGNAPNPFVSNGPVLSGKKDELKLEIRQSTSDGTAFVLFDGGKPGPVQFRIFTPGGQTVLLTERKDATGVLEIKESLPAGMYLIEMKSETGRKVGKWVKM